MRVMNGARLAIMSVCVSVLMLNAELQAAELTGKVVAVVDGDTLDVLVDRQKIRVRLIGIDAPESGQPFGARSKQRLAELAFPRAVSVSYTESDRYGRVLGRVSESGLDLNAMMVAEGWAWAYRYRGRAVDSGYVQLEQAAKWAALGLWADEGATPPWEWREQSRR